MPLFRRRNYEESPKPNTRRVGIEDLAQWLEPGEEPWGVLRGFSATAQQPATLFTFESRAILVIDGFRATPLLLPYDGFLGAAFVPDGSEVGFEAKRPLGIPDDALLAESMRNHPRRGGKKLSEETFFAILTFDNRRSDLVGRKTLELLAKRLDEHIQFPGPEHEERFRREIMGPG